jgi:IS4 transposase
MEWSPRSVCDLYRRRWDIEVFFKQVKQSLKLGSFLGKRSTEHLLQFCQRSGGSGSYAMRLSMA